MEPVGGIGVGLVWWVLWLGGVPGVVPMAPTQVPPNVQKPAGEYDGYVPADPSIWAPQGSARPEDGGFYFSAGVLIFRQTSPHK
jgi:hypothetical protein